jgi:hypothetical protein
MRIACELGRFPTSRRTAPTAEASLHCRATHAVYARNMAPDYSCRKGFAAEMPTPANAMKG